jgi:DNA-binding response OmpR family regulator
VLGPLWRKNVLIAEDDALILEDLKSIIVFAGGVVESCAPTCTEALGFVTSRHFDGVLLDALLRDGPAVDIGRMLRRNGMPFIFVTGYELHALPLDLQGEPYIAKPFTSELVINMAAKHFRSAGR